MCETKSDPIENFQNVFDDEVEHEEFPKMLWCHLFASLLDKKVKI
jgi:hypothetical protein